jgi:fluoroacetyl-CoA thioesterase
MDVAAGLQGRVERIVADDDTAIALGSGDVPVLATPRLLAWAEAATVAALEGGLDRASTSVGSTVTLEHLAASPVGATVVVAAELVEIDGTTLRFTVTARDADREIARGAVTRVIVDRERFLARLRRR